MDKDSKPAKVGFVLAKLHLVLIVFIILLMLGVVYIYGKNKEEQQKKIAPTPSPTLMPSPTPSPTLMPSPTPSPTFKPSTSQPSETYQKQQRIPVYLSHNGQTYYCDSMGVDAVRDASNMIVKIQEEIAECGNKMIDSTKECVEKCKAEAEHRQSQCSIDSLSFADCLSAGAQYGLSCTGGCRNQIIKCPSEVPPSRYDSLNSLLNTYCNH
jgi:hypothetical protein